MKKELPQRLKKAVDDKLRKVTKPAVPPKSQNIRKQSTFDAYVAWLSVDHAWWDKSDDFFEKYGVPDGELREMMKIQHKTAFAEKYSITRKQLSLWDKTINVEEILKKNKRFMALLAPKVRMSLIKRIIKDGGANEVKLYEKVINDWVENTRVQFGGAMEMELSEEDRARIDKVLAENNL